MSREFDHPSAEDVLGFWFGTPADAWFGKARAEWFRKDTAFDDQIRTRFGALHAQIAGGGSRDWLDEPRSALALVIVLDQFSRNLFRGDPRAFACDPQALLAAESALERGFDRHLTEVERPFLYLPFQHSEKLVQQERSMGLFEQLAREDPSSDNLSYALQHLKIIQRFGRFPHRNQVLGRPSTEAELAFLKEPNSSF
jgi:uncharacterized protein (DUF924 family)